MTDLGAAPRLGGDGATSAASDGSLRVRRRRGLPGGRALIGGFLVAASAVGLFAAHALATAGPRHTYVVAAHDLEIGDRLDTQDLTRIPLDLPDALAARTFSSPDDLVGATVLARRAAGELLQVTDLVMPPGEAGTREFSFAVDPSRALGDRIRAGERVDVVATYGTGGDAYTMVVVPDARVLRAAAGGGVVGEGRLELTLELHGARSVLALAHAVDVAQITVVRATAAAEEAGEGTYRPGQGTDPATADSEDG
jgi:Flp pilus assembly protein CpaB